MVVIDTKTATKQQILFKLNDTELDYIESCDNPIDACYDTAINFYSTMCDKSFTCLYARLISSDILRAVFQYICD